MDRTYRAEISRTNPGCLVFLVDQSGSMARRLAGTGQQKKHAVADVINRFLYNLVLRCAKEHEIRPYFDVGVFGYGIDSSVQSAFDEELISIATLESRPKRIEVRQRAARDANGEVYEEEMQLPIWFEPMAQGQTPMNAAFERAERALQGWIGRHRDSFPPIILNITDGGFTDRNPAPTVERIRALATSDGPVLVLNCHITEGQGEAEVFPDDARAARFEKRQRELYMISSPLPEPIRQQARASGYTITDGSRGYAFNADFATLVDFLDIGTQAVRDRMEEANE